MDHSSASKPLWNLSDWVVIEQEGSVQPLGTSQGSLAERLFPGFGGLLEGQV
jgi:hypothetical protein